MITFGMVGAGGLGCEMVYLVPHSLQARFPGLRDDQYQIVFVESAPKTSEYEGLPVVSVDDFIASADEGTFFNIAVSDSQDRQLLAEQLDGQGLQAMQLNHTTAEVRSGNDIAPGGIFSFQSLITTRIKIGRYFNCMAYSQVAHDCVIGDYVSFYSRVDCNGYVVIEDHVTVGNAACIRNGSPDKPLRIGKGATIGMGAVVTKDVPAGAIVVGNPARVIAR